MSLNTTFVLLIIDIITVMISVFLRLYTLFFYIPKRNKRVFPKRNIVRFTLYIVFTSGGK